MSKKIYWHAIALVFLATALGPAPAPAQVCEPLDDGRLADVRYEGTLLLFEPIVEFREMVLTIGGPCEDIVRVFKKGEQVSFDIREITKVTDGTYHWELRRVASIDPGVQEELQAARGSGKEDGLWWSYFQKGAIPEGPYVESGAFSVERGLIVDPGQVEEKRAAVGSKAGGALAGIAAAGVSTEAAPAGGTGDNPLATKDFVINDDLIVIGSTCVGFDCVNGEVFGFDTLRLKENNTRIQFNDTSGSSFPTRNWQIRANASGSGGENFLGFVDQGNNDTSETGTLVFAVEAGAGSNALRIDSSGRAGFGTGNPVVELHVVDGDTPALRLEQDGSSGFQPQVWDVAGNETSFFVRDATNGSTLPFRIFPASPSNTLVVRDGEVGIRDLSPDDFLDVDITGGNGGVTIESTTDGNLPQLTLIEPTRSWRFRVANNGNFVFTDATAGNSPVQLVGAANSNLLVVGGTNTVAGDPDRVTVNGELFIGTSMVTPDYVFEPDFELESIEEHAEYMWTHKHLPAVGGARVSGDQHLIDVGATQFGMLEELEKAHVYIEQLHASLETRREEITGLAEDRRRLEERQAEMAEELRLLREQVEALAGVPRN